MAEWQTPFHHGRGRGSGSGRLPHASPSVSPSGPGGLAASEPSSALSLVTTPAVPVCLVVPHFGQGRTPGSTVYTGTATGTHGRNGQGVGSAFALPLAPLTKWTVTPQTFNEGRLRVLGHAVTDDELNTARLDVENDKAAREFMRAHKAPKAAATIQNWWRVATSLERRRFQSYIVMLKYRRTLARKPFFRSWRQEARALSHARRTAWGRSFYAWREVAQLTDILAKQLTSLLSHAVARTAVPVIQLWRISATVTKSDAAADNGSGGTALAAALAAAVLTRQIPFRMKQSVLEAWRKTATACRRDAMHGAMHIARFGRSVRTSRLRHSFRFWFRYALTKIADRVGVPPPVFKPTDPVWDAWYWSHKKHKNLVKRAREGRRIRVLLGCFLELKTQAQLTVAMRTAWLWAARFKRDALLESGLDAFRLTRGLGLAVRFRKSVYFDLWRRTAGRHKVVRGMRKSLEEIHRRFLQRLAVRHLVQHGRARAITDAAAEARQVARQPLLLWAVSAWRGDNVHCFIAAAWIAWSGRVMRRIRFCALVVQSTNASRLLATRNAFDGWCSCMQIDDETKQHYDSDQEILPSSDVDDAFGPVHRRDWSEAPAQPPGDNDIDVVQYSASNIRARVEHFTSTFTARGNHAEVARIVGVPEPPAQRPRSKRGIRAHSRLSSARKSAEAAEQLLEKRDEDKDKDKFLLNCRSMWDSSKEMRDSLKSSAKALLTWRNGQPDVLLWQRIVRLMHARRSKERKEQAEIQAEVAPFGLSSQTKKGMVICNGVVICEWGVTAISVQDALFARRLVQDEFALFRRALELIGLDTAVPFARLDSAAEIFSPLQSSTSSSNGSDEKSPTTRVTTKGSNLLGDKLSKFFGVVIAARARLWYERVSHRAHKYSVAIADGADTSVTRQLHAANRRFTLVQRRRRIADHTLMLLSDSSDEEACIALARRRNRGTARGAFYRWRTFASRRRSKHSSAIQQASPDIKAATPSSSVPSPEQIVPVTLDGHPKGIPSLEISPERSPSHSYAESQIQLSPSTMRLLERRREMEMERARMERERRIGMLRESDPALADFDTNDESLDHERASDGDESSSPSLLHAPLPAWIPDLFPDRSEPSSQRTSQASITRISEDFAEARAIDIPANASDDFNTIIEARADVIETNEQDYASGTQSGVQKAAQVVEDSGFAQAKSTTGDTDIIPETQLTTQAELNDQIVPLPLTEDENSIMQLEDGDYPSKEDSTSETKMAGDKVISQFEAQQEELRNHEGVSSLLSGSIGSYFSRQLDDDDVGDSPSEDEEDEADPDRDDDDEEMKSVGISKWAEQRREARSKRASSTDSEDVEKDDGVHHVQEHTPPRFDALGRLLTASSPQEEAAGMPDYVPSGDLSTIAEGDESADAIAAAGRRAAAARIRPSQMIVSSEQPGSILAAIPAAVQPRSAAQAPESRVSKEKESTAHTTAQQSEIKAEKNASQAISGEGVSGPAPREIVNASPEQGPDESSARRTQDETVDVGKELQKDVVYYSDNAGEGSDLPRRHLVTSEDASAALALAEEAANLLEEPAVAMTAHSSQKPFGSDSLDAQYLSNALDPSEEVFYAPRTNLAVIKEDPSTGTSKPVKPRRNSPSRQERRLSPKRTEARSASHSPKRTETSTKSESGVSHKQRREKKPLVEQPEPWPVHDTSSPWSDESSTVTATTISRQSTKSTVRSTRRPQEIKRNIPPTRRSHEIKRSASPDIGKEAKLPPEQTWVEEASVIPQDPPIPLPGMKRVGIDQSLVPQISGSADHIESKSRAKTSTQPRAKTPTQPRAKTSTQMRLDETSSAEVKPGKITHNLRSSTPTQSKPPRSSSVPVSNTEKVPARKSGTGVAWASPLSGLRGSDAEESPAPHAMSTKAFDERYMHAPRRAKENFAKQVEKFRHNAVEKAYDNAVQQAVDTKSASPFSWSPSDMRAEADRKMESRLFDARDYPTAGGGFIGGNVVPYPRSPDLFHHQHSDRHDGDDDNDMRGSELTLSEYWLRGGITNDLESGESRFIPQATGSKSDARAPQYSGPGVRSSGTFHARLAFPSPPATAGPRRAFRTPATALPLPPATAPPPLEASHSAPVLSSNAVALLFGGTPLSAALMAEESFGQPRNDRAWLRVGSGGVATPPPIPLARDPSESRLEPLAPRSFQPGKLGIFGPPDLSDARRMSVNGSHLTSKREHSAIMTRRQNLERWRGTGEKKRARMQAARALRSFLNPQERGGAL